MNRNKPRARQQRVTKRQESYHTVPGLKVTVGDGERDFEKALRLFNKKVQASGLLREIRDREFYEKPSIVKKRNKDIAVKREKRKNQEALSKRKRKF
jgi:small subunit ribosomal protein S21